MHPVPHPQPTKRYTKPKSWTDEQECGDLIVQEGQDEHGHPTIASAWRPSEEELQTLLAGGAVQLTVWANCQPPVSLGVIPAERLNLYDHPGPEEMAELISPAGLFPVLDECYAEG